jgi:outer membrane protein assembly factor BamB
MVHPTGSSLFISAQVALTLQLGATIAAVPPRKPLRLWPGALAVALQWVIMFGLPIFVPEQGGTAILAGVAGGLAVVLWWLFFSRAPWPDRLGAILLMMVAVAATSRLVHASIANGMMGFMLFLYAIPVMSLALVASAAAGRGLSIERRRAAMVAAILIACGALTLIRTNGITGNAVADFEWRWTPTPEERLLASAGDAPVAVPATLPTATTAPSAVPSAVESPEARVPKVNSETGLAVSEQSRTRVEWLAMSEQGRTRVEWPGFRGPARDGVVPGVRIETDWSRTPPVELWRRPIGPGWSSFAVAGDRLFTQEQRGEDEIVSAFSLKTGEPVWSHRDAERFWESNAGAGPRGTPTLNDGRVYTLGATGILNALDARDGSEIWSRNAASDTGRKIPDWGIASSPLVVGDVVIVAIAGSLVAYDLATGKPRWYGPKGGSGYSSPHLATIDGVAHIVLVNGPGAIGVAPSDGAVLWTHAWGGDSIVQPAVLAGGDILIGSGSGLAANSGMLRINVARKPLQPARGEPGEWHVTERWTSTGLKPYFNDFVVHQGHAFGFDGSILSCIDLEDGTRKWKGGRYGHGQLVVLPDQNLLLVLSEDGELALVSATPDKFTELARVPAIEGKTWNHPVLVGDILLVWNGQEMAAFKLTRTNR